VGRRASFSVEGGESESLPKEENPVRAARGKVTTARSGFLDKHGRKIGYLWLKELKKRIVKKERFKKRRERTMADVRPKMKKRSLRPGGVVKNKRRRGVRGK